MDFSFTEEQTLLRNMVQGFLQDKYDFETRRKIVASDEGWSKDFWQEWAELGLLAAPFSEEQGGLGGGAIDTMVIMEEFGRALVVEPYMETVVLAGGFLREGASEAQQAAHIPGIVAGENVWAVAYAEPQGRYNLADLVTTAKADGEGFVLNGYKAVVLGGPWADKLIVTARTSGGQRDSDGVSVFIVDKSAAGVSARDYPTVDGRRASEITFENVKLGADALIGEAGKGLPLVEKVIDQGIGALCAEAVGGMKELNDATVEYCKTRKQFGVPIGKFQVLQHRMVDMFMSYEQTKSLLVRAMCSLAEENEDAEKSILALKVMVGRAGKHIGGEAIQLHGGMGITDELDVGHYVKRLMMINALFGDADYQQQKFSALTNQ